MCDCFHLVLPNWPGSPASASGRQLRPEDTEADGEADAEDDSVNEVTIENIRPRPQGSSPVYEYCIEDEYFNKKLQQDMENRQRRDSSIRMNGSQESMEVTLQTEVESGASGFSVAGGGAEGLFVKQVIQESPASTLFHLREGDQLLSATIYFENIKYEDALKILQYSEPYKVQFNLKRKLTGKEELEAMQPISQFKKERLSQEKELLEITDKSVTEDQANLIVKQRVGRAKRPKKDRLSWPKFQSMKGKKILGHRRSRSTSDAYEHAFPDASPTSTDTELQFQQEDIQPKHKKGSQKKLKFPSIGFKMHRSKQETEERTKYEVNAFTDYEHKPMIENQELTIAEDSTFWLHQRKTGEEQEGKPNTTEQSYELTYNTTKCPDVEISTKKPKEKKSKSKQTTKLESSVVTTQVTTHSETSDMKETLSKSLRKKKKKETSEKNKVKTEEETEHKQIKMDIKETLNITGVEMEGKITQAAESKMTTIQDLQVEEPSADIAVEGADSKFKMPKFQMPKFGISLPKGKAAAEGEITLPSVDIDVSKPELKAEVKAPSLAVEGDVKVPTVDIQAPSLEVELGEKGKIKMPDVKMPSVKLPKMKGPQVSVGLPKGKADVTLPEVELPEGEISVKAPDAKGSIDVDGKKMHMPKFKMPSMGFSKPDIKGPKVDVDISLPEVDVSIPKPELKAGGLEADISVSAPDIKVPTGKASVDLKTPDLQLEAPSADIAVEGADSKFKMPKFQMPKFGISLPKGKAAAEGEITLPSVDIDVSKPELKAEVKAPTLAVEGDVKVPTVDIQAPSLEVELGEKGKIKMPDVKMPSVKLPKMKGPQVSVGLPKGKADVTLPEVELPEGEISVKVPDAKGSIDVDGKKMHMPKFKMPSMGFSKPDIKGPKVDVDISLPEVDVSIPKPELKAGGLEADISVSAPDIKVPTGKASVDLKTPDLQLEAPSADIAVEGADSKFKMPKLQMPKFGISLPKGKAAAEGEITLPSVDIDVSKPELKAEVKAPSLAVEGDVKVPTVDIQAPSLEVELGEKGKIKMPDVKMPSVKLPKMKGPQVSVGLPKGKADVTLPEVELPEGEISVKAPDAKGSIDVDGKKMHMPKFKMPSMGFSKPDIKGPKVDVDISLPEVDVSIPKPELKAGGLEADISVSAPDIKVPTGKASVDLKTPDLQLEAPSADIAVEGADSKFKMPKLQMPKFGISLPKGKAAAEGEITLPSVDIDVSKPELKAEVKAPSLAVEGDVKVPTVDIQAPSLEVELGEKGKIKMPDVKMPSVKLPKMKGPQVSVGLPKGKADVTLPEVELPEGEISVKATDAKGSIDVDGKKMHMPKFKMPSMGFSIPDIKGPKVDVDISLPEVDVSIPKPELKAGGLEADISVSAPDIKVPTGKASVDLKTPDLQLEAPSADIAVEGADSKFKMPKFQMPKFGISLPKGKAAAEGEITLPSVDIDVSKPELKAEVKAPTLAVEGDVKVPTVDIQAPSLEVELGEKGKIKMPDVKMPSVKLPKMKGPQVSVGLPKGKADVTLPEVELPEGEISVKAPDAKGSIDVDGKKMHMPKFKMPSMGFSKPDIKGPKVDVDISLPEVDVSIPKPELKAGGLEADISVSAPDIKVPTGKASVDLKTPDLQLEAPSADIAVEGADSKFKMPKLQMPKFGISLPKGKAAAEGEITLPSVDIDVSKPELKAEVKAPSLAVEGDVKVPTVDIQAPSLEVELGEKGKIKMPDVKMPSVKLPKMKGPQVSVGLPKGKADVTLPEVELPEGEISVKAPDAKGSIDVDGKKMHMPKFKMPSMGFSIPDIKGPKVDVDISLPEVDVSIPKPELKAGGLEADISVSAPDIKVPTGKASVDLKTPDLQLEAPSADIAVEGADSKFKMPKFQMPKFGISLPKGKAAAEGEITLPSVDIDVSKPELKAEVKAPTLAVEGDVKVPTVDIQAPSLEVELGEKGKIKMPDVKMPSVKLPKMKGPQVSVGLPKGKADVTLPEVELPEGEISVKAPDAKGSIDVDGKKMHMPKFKMPSMGFSKPDIKGPKVDVDISLPEVDVSIPKPELKAGGLEADISVSAPDIKVPTGKASVDLKTPDLQLEAPSADIAVEGADSKFKMPKLQMPKFGISLPKGKAAAEGEITLPSVDIDVSKPELKAEVKAPSLAVEGDVKVPTVDIQAPSLEVELGEKGKIKMPDVKMPSVKLPKMKGPQVSVGLPKGKADVTLPEVELPEGEISVKAPDAKGSIDVDGKKMHMPKFKMPSMGFSIPDIKGPKVDVDISLPEVDVSIPKPELKAGGLEADISVSAPDIKVPTGKASVDLKTPDLQLEAPSADIAVEGADSKFKMPKFQMPKFGISLPKGKAAAEGEITLPSVDIDVSKPELKAEVKAPTLAVEGDVKVPTVDIQAPSLEVELGEKGKIKMPDVKMPSVKLPKMKGPQVSVGLPKGKADVTPPEVELPEGEISVKVPDAKGSIDVDGKKMHMPKFKMPSMGFSKPDIKGPKVDVDISLPEVDVSIPKPELKAGGLEADISVSAPDIKVPTGKASVDLKTPDLQLEAPSADIAVEGADSKFKMPKLQMPKFGISLPKGKAAAEGEITLPSVDIDVSKPELKAEVKAPSLAVEGDVKVPTVDIQAPSLEVELGEKGKIKMPDVKMPSVKLPKMKGPQVSVGLPKGKADVTLPEVELPEGDISVKAPDAKGSIDVDGKKMHMPKFKMPSMGFSKPDIKGPKVDVDISLPEVDVSIPKPELKAGGLEADISVSTPDIKVPTGKASVDLKTPDLQLEAPSADIAVEGADSKFKMPKFQMPKFGISLPKGKAAAEGEITLPSVDIDVSKPELKAEVKAPTLAVEGDVKVPTVDIQAPSLEVELGEKGKIKMPDVKMPSVKLPKMKGPQVSVGLPKGKADVTPPEVELPEGEISVKVPDAKGSIDVDGKKMHMPKFKMPSMGFSKPDIKGPKVDVDISLPEVDVSIPKPELKAGGLEADISVSAPDIKVPTGKASVDLKTPDLQLEAPSADIAVEGADSKFKMPKLQMPKFGISLPKGKAAAEGEITLPSVDIDVSKPELKAEVKAPSLAVEGDVKVPTVDIQAPSLEVELGEKGKIKMPDVKMPSVKLPKMKGPQVSVGLPKGKADVTLPEVELPEGEISVKAPDAKGSIDVDGKKMHMPKFKMPSMGFSKPDIKGPKVDVDISLPVVDVSIPKPELKAGGLEADISVSAPDIKVPTGKASVDLKTPDLQLEAPSADIAVEGADSKFKMPKFQMPKFGISLPKGKAAAEGEITLPSVDIDVSKPELKAEVKAPSLAVEGDVKVPTVDIQAPSLEVELGEKGKIKMPDVKMPSVKLPKMKGPQVSVGLPKGKADVTLPEVELPEGEISVKAPDAKGSIDVDGKKMHMPKFKMPSMGFSKPDIKGPKVDVDISLPEVDVSIPKPELKAGGLEADISVSAPDIKVPTGKASVDLKTPDLQLEAPSADIAVEGADSKFKMPKFQMPKFGISLPKGKAAAEGEITLPSVDIDVSKPELKAEVKAPSLAVEGDVKVPTVDIQAPSLEVELGEKGKIKMPDVKMPSVKLPKMKGPQVSVGLPKGKADVTLPEVELPEGEISVKAPDAKGSIDVDGKKMHMPKFKMPSMGFSKPDIKGPKVDVDISLPEVDVSIPKPELKAGGLEADISVSAPDIKVPTGKASVDLKTPDLQLEAPSADIAVEGADSKFKMPKFQMPKFGISLPKGKAAAEGEITLPSVDIDVSKPELKAEVKAPTLAVEGDVKVPTVDIQAPSLEVELGEKGKIKMPDVKMPSVKLPKMKGPQVSVGLPKGKADVTLPEVELPEGEISVKAPDAKGSIDVDGKKMHMPKFKMPSMGFSKPDIKGPKVDVDISLPEVDVSIPKPELKAGGLEADISVSAPDIKVPTGKASVDLKTPDLQLEAPSADIAVEGADSKFKMPKFQMPKFGISLPKGKAAAEGEITLPSVDIDVSKPELKAEVKAPTLAVEGDVKVPTVDIQAPSLEVELGEKGKIKMPDVKMPSVKLPKMKGPQVSVGLPKGKADVTLPEVELPEGEISVKAPDAKGSIDVDGKKMHMPKFKMPSMGFSKPDIKGPKVDVDISLPEVDVSIPKPELKAGGLEADISVSAPDIKVPTGKASVDLKTPDLQLEAPSADIAVEGADSKFKMPKFQMPKFGISLPKGKAAAEGEITLPSVDIDVSKPELKAEVKAPSLAVEGDVKVPTVDIQAPSLEVELGEKGKIKMPDVKMPSVKLPKMKGPQVSVGLPKGKADVTLPEVELPEGEISVKATDAKGSIDVDGKKMHMPKFKMPSMGFSKPDIKGPKVDVDISLPVVDVSIPKLELKAGGLEADISVSAPDIKVPTGKASVDLKTPDLQLEAPSADIAVEGADSKFKMPKFQMPKFGISLPKGKAAAEGEITLPSVDIDVSKPELKAEVKAPTLAVEGDVKVPTVDIQAPSLEVELGEKGKIKMPDVKMPSVKLPKMKGPQVSVGLPKGKADVTLPEVELPEGEISVKAPDAKGSIDVDGKKMHMPKFKMPSMGFSKPDIKGPKVDVDISLPEVDVSIPKPELKAGGLEADISVSTPDIKVPTGKASVDLKTPDLQLEAPSADIAVEGADSKFKMPKFQMPKFGISLPKGKAAAEGEITLPSVDIDVSKPELKAEVKAPSLAVEGDVKVPTVDIQAPSLEVELGEKGKIKMPDVKMPSVKLPKMKGPQVSVGLPKGKADVTLPEVELPEGEISVKAPDAKGSIDVDGKKMHMPKFKMPSMGFSKPDIKGPKVDVDISLPEVDVSIPKPELKAGGLEADISVSAPDIKVPTGKASVDLKTPDLQLEAPSADIAVEGADSKFKMPKFQMPKFGISLPKGKAAAEGEITLPSVDIDVSKPELKAEVKAPSLAVEGDVKVPTVDIQAPSLEVELGEKGKIKMPDVKMPSVKLPKMKGPQVSVGLPKGKADVTLPEVELPEGEISVKVPDAKGSIDVDGKKMHMPKFKMPSMGFSKPDIKGPKVDVDISLPEVDVSIPKPELKAGGLEANISVSAPDIKVPTGKASVDLKTPDLQLEAPSADIAVEGADSKFKMPKFQMPKFGISLPKGKAAAEGEITLPSVDIDVSKPELKAEVKAPSLAVEGDVKVPTVDIQAPSLEVELGEKGKIKMPDVKMPSVKLPKMKGPQVSVGLPKGKADVTLPEVELPEGEISVKAPDAKGSIDVDGKKMHMPKFKMPSMGFSKPDIKGPKVDVDISLPEVDISIPKPELKAGGLEANISVSAPDIKVPTGKASVDLKTPDLQLEAPSADIAVEGADSKFKMPKFQMPKFGISLPKGKAAAEGEITLPSVDIDVSKPELKAEVKAPTLAVEGDVKVPTVDIQAPSLEVELGEKGKIKMPDVKMPSVKLPKMKGPQVSVGLPKGKADVTLPEVELPEGEISVKAPDAKGSIDVDGKKMHMPKFKMPSMGFSKPDIKGPKVDVDISLPEVDVSIPKPELKAGGLEADISVSVPDIKVPTGKASVDLKTPELQLEAPSADIAVEGADSKFKMPKFQMPKFGISYPKRKEAADSEITLPSFEADISKPEFSFETNAVIQKADHKSDDSDGKTESSGWKISMPSFKKAKAPLGDIKGTLVDVNQLAVDVEASKGDIDVSCIENDEINVSIDDGGPSFDKLSKKKDLKFKMPKLNISSFGKSTSSKIVSEGNFKESQQDKASSGPGVKIMFSQAEIINPTLNFESQPSLVEVGDKCDVKMPEVSLDVPESHGHVGGLNISLPRFRLPNLGFAKVDVTPPKIDDDGSLVDNDVTLTKYSISQDSVLEPVRDEGLEKNGKSALTVQCPEMGNLGMSADTDFSAAEISIDGSRGKIQMPKFQMPKFGLSHDKVSESKISVSKFGIDTPEIETDVQIKDMRTSEDLEVDAGVSCPKMQISPMKVPQMPKGDSKISEIDLSLPSVDISVQKPEIDIQGPDLDSKDVETETGEKATGEKESKFKMPKFKLPSFGWSPKKEASISADIDANVKETSATILASEVESELMLTVEDIDSQVEELGGHVSIDKDSEKSKSKRPQFRMRKISLPKIKGQKSEVSLPQPDTNIASSKAEGGDISLRTLEKEDTVDDAKKGIKMPKVKLPSLELSKPEIKAPKVDMDVSLPKGDVKLLTLDASLATAELKPVDVGADITISTAEMKVLHSDELKGPKIELQGKSIEVYKDVAEIKSEAVDGKIKRPKFHMPKFGRSFSKGKLPDTEITVEADVPQLKTMTDIADIAVEAPTFEVECGTIGVEKTSLDEKLKMPQIPISEMKTSSVDISIPSAGISVIQSDSDVTAKELSLKGDIQTGSLEAEEKSGHFKFKLPSFSWSPKKEASLDIKEPLEEPKLTALSDDTNAELTVVLSEHQRADTDLDAEISTKKGQMKRPHFVMPKISLPKPKLTKAQGSLPKVETDITVERNEALVQIPDIESSLSTGTEEGTEISIKMPKGMSKPKIKSPQIDSNLPKADTKVPIIDSSLELKSSKAGFDRPSGEIDMDSAIMEKSGMEGKIRIAKLQMPKFGISDPEKKLPESEIVLPKMEAEQTQLQVTTEIAREAPVLDIKADIVDAEIKLSGGKIKMPQMPKGDVKASKVTVGSPDEKDIKVQEEHKTKSGEIQTEESQGWFKMPKFRIPSFGRSSSKGKKSDVEVEDSSVKASATEVQVEINVPEIATPSFHVETESYPEKATLEGKVTFPQVETTEGDISIQKEKGSPVGLLVGECSLSQSLQKAETKLSGTKTYADVVKHGAEGQGLEIHKPSFTAPTLEIGALKMKCEMSPQQHKIKSDTPTVDCSTPKKSADTETEAACTEITVGETEKKIDVAVRKTDVVVKSPDAVAETDKMESQIKSPKKNTQEKESIFKMPKFSIPSFGWSSTKSTSDVADVISNLEQSNVASSEIKMDNSILDEDFEIIEFPAEGFEKDASAESEEKEKSSKSKASKFKMPKFGNLHTKAEGSDIHAEPPKMEVKMPPAKTEEKILEIQDLNAKGSINLKSTKLAGVGQPEDVMDNQSAYSQVGFHMRKLKMPKFTYSTSTDERHILTSEERTDVKSTTTSIDSASQQELRTKFLEEKVEHTGYSIQKSTVKITTLSEPAIQRTQVESKLPRTDTSFEETTVRMQRPTDFSTEIPKGKIDTMGGSIQKSVAKITTVTEPDIKTTQFGVKPPSESVFMPSASMHCQRPPAEGIERKLKEKSAFSYGESESHETITSQIVRESEITPSEIKTATYGFSLVKVKVQESYVSLDAPVKISSTEYANKMFESKDQQSKPSAESSEARKQSSSDDQKLSRKSQDLKDEKDKGASSTTSNLKTFTVKVQSSSEFVESHFEKQHREITSDASSKDHEDTYATGTGEEPADEKEKTDKISSGRYKFWFPNIGFSSSVDDSTPDSKTEAQKSFSEATQVEDPSMSDSDFAKQTEKTGWFRFPKLGFSSPTKKSKEADKEEEADPKERKPDDEGSPTEKSETFFDAQETLPLKETITEKEDCEASVITHFSTIVSSSARTELILLEKGKVVPQSITEESSK